VNELRTKLAPPAMRHLLDAEPVDDDEPPPSAKIQDRMAEEPTETGDRVNGRGRGRRRKAC